MDVYYFNLLVEIILYPFSEMLQNLFNRNISFFLIAIKQALNSCNLKTVIFLVKYFSRFSYNRFVSKIVKFIHKYSKNHQNYGKIHLIPGERQRYIIKFQEICYTEKKIILESTKFLFKILQKTCIQTKKCLFQQLNFSLLLIRGFS